MYHDIISTMRDKLLVQYGAIRETMRTNIETIGRLIKQAEALKEIVSKVTDDQIKESLSDELGEIEGTIRTLLDQTDRLFDKYDEFVKTLFGSSKK